MTPHPILAQVDADVAEYRDQAAEHARAAAGLAEQMEEPAALLKRMAAEEADLARKLEALRNEMVDVRKAYDAFDAERDRHKRAFKAKCAIADGLELAAEEAAAALGAPPPHEALAEVGLMVEPPKVVAQVVQLHNADDVNVPGAPLAEVAAVTGGLPVLADPDALAAGSPVTTLTDPPAGERWRHRAPRDSTGTGGIRTLPGRVGERLGLVHRETTAEPATGDEQDGDDQ